MGVFADINRAMDVLTLTVFDNGLSDCGDVVFVERTIERSATVTAGAKGHLLFGQVYIRVDFEIGINQFGDVD